jgi:hypothetical protein
VFRRHTSTQAQFAIHYKYLTIIRFIAPETGRYAFLVKSSRWGQSNDPAESIMALAALKFTWKGGPGQILALEKRRHDSTTALAMEFETELLAGEEIAFVPDADHWRGSWMNFSITAGLF